MSKQQAYIAGFVKRAEQYGLSEEQALGLLKESFFGEMGASVDKGLSNIGQGISRAVHGVTDPVVGAVKQIGQNVSKGYHSVADPIETWWKGDKTPNDVNLAVARSRMSDALDGKGMMSPARPAISPAAGAMSLGSPAPQGAATGGPFRLSLGGPNSVSLNGPAEAPDPNRFRLTLGGPNNVSLAGGSALPSQREATQEAMRTTPVSRPPSMGALPNQREATQQAVRTTPVSRPSAPQPQQIYQGQPGKVRSVTIGGTQYLV